MIICMLVIQTQIKNLFLSHRYKFLLTSKIFWGWFLQTHYARNFLEYSHWLCMVFKVIQKFRFQIVIGLHSTWSTYLDFRNARAFSIWASLGRLIWRVFESSSSTLCLLKEASHFLSTVGKRLQIQTTRDPKHWAWRTDKEVDCQKEKRRKHLEKTTLFDVLRTQNARMLHPCILHAIFIGLLILRFLGSSFLNCSVLPHNCWALESEFCFYKIIVLTVWMKTPIHSPLRLINYLSED